ncbi:MAG: hypothetical protein AAF790_14575 [Planctomycetota bacterium]
MLAVRGIVFSSALVVMALCVQAQAEPLWKRFMPVKRVPADAAASYTLAEGNGPWMIMACTFSGPGAEAQARELVLEFRQRYNTPAFAHAMQFDLSSETVGRGIDKYGAPIKMRHKRGDRLQEWAVLAGEFPSIDDPQAQKLLRSVKTMRPEALNPQARGGETSQSLAFARSVQRRLVPRLGQSKQLGPMRTAFLARNPLLPREYFVPKGVDKFVEKMNRGARYSLLNNPKPFTVKVATFSGQTVIQGAANAPKAKRRKLSPLEEAAYNAELLAAALREANFEAYEFHDRYQSIVTVGGFDAADLKAPPAEMAQIFRTFGAAFNTPEDPLQHARLDQKVGSITQQHLLQFQQQFRQRQQNQPSMLAGGLKPKFARVPPKAKDARVIPFDIQPEVIEAPKKTVSGFFAWGR